MATVELRPGQEAEATSMEALMRRSVTALCREAYGDAVIKVWMAKDNPVFIFRVPDRSIIAEIDGVMVGFAGWSPKATLSLNPEGRLDLPLQYARIQNVFVDPDVAGQGVGRVLMDWMEADIRSQGLRERYLWSTQSAIPFYQAVGYVCHDTGQMAVGEDLSVAVTLMTRGIEGAITL